MASYVFETMSVSDAAAFTTDDNLVFQTAAPTALGVTDVTPLTHNGLFPGSVSATSETITLDMGGYGLTFNADVFSAATMSGHVSFQNGDGLVVGTNGLNAVVLNDTGPGHGMLVYGFDNNDTISGTSSANDTINGGQGDDTIHGSSSYTDAGGHFTENDLYQGGDGNDYIVGGDGNDHIYGNLMSSSIGSADGDDTLMGGGGNDYIQGNAGNDLLGGGDGNDREYGGSGDDIVLGGDGNDYLQGNKGDDHVDGGAGNDTVHGGEGNDVLFAGSGTGDDQLYGDQGDDLVEGSTGNDTIVGGAGYDELIGHEGNDVFQFAAGDADIAHLTSDPAADPYYHGLVDKIDDFQDGTDHIALGFTVRGVIHGDPTVTLADGSAALTYAQTLMSASVGHHGTQVVALTVGSDTYLFWNDTHSSTTIDASLRLVGVTDDHINAGNGSDFI